MKKDAVSLRIGITIGLVSEDDSLWRNGIKQNAMFLAETLRHCPNVDAVWLVNTTAVPITSALPWDQKRWPVVTLDDVKDHLDVMIELGGQINAAMTAYLKGRGARLVSYCCGSEYISAMQAAIFDRQVWGSRLFINQNFDAIWMVPQIADLNKHYFQTLRRKQADVVPFVWSPSLLEERTRQMSSDGYKPNNIPKRLTVMEPNNDIVKFCLYPILIVEEAYRRRPESISFLHVTNAEKLAKGNEDFIAIMGYLDIVRDHKVSFVGRYETPQFLSQFTDMVVSHQWGNPLNYFYFDVCWLGYPLIHNASLCKDLGYYYEGNDVQQGAEVLTQALIQHDRQWESYADAQKRAISRFFPDNDDVVKKYTNLLHGLFASSSV